MSPMISYEPTCFGKERLEKIEQANEIIEAYQAQGYDLTLRQLYYQFVSRDYIPNNQKEYAKLGALISAARRAGMIDWDAIVDRTRQLEKLGTWGSPADIVAEDARVFKLDLWAEQPYYVEVWFEKEALAGIFERVAQQWRVPFLACRGYPSDSEVWRAAQRIAEKNDDGKEVVILHFGDHDPSGLDMTRDIRDRLQLFEAGAVDLRRLALNRDQIRRYRPPPNPAKESDSRFAGYRAEHGDRSWELDALEPQVLAGLVEGEVGELIDVPQWKDDKAREDKARAELVKISRQLAKKF